MKILRIIARLNVGGPARHVVWLTEALQDKEFQTTLIAGSVPTGEDDMAYFAKEHCVVPVYLREMSREISFSDIGSLIKLFRLIKLEEPDVIHTHTAKAGTLGRTAGLFYRWLTWKTLIGRPRKVKFVHTFHGHVFHSYYSAAKTRVFLLIEKLLARAATDKVVVLSNQQFDEIHLKFKVGRPDQFSVVPLGIDVKAFELAVNARQRLRNEISAGEGETVIGFVGRLTEIKNIPLFLRAAVLMREKPVRFVIVGDGHLRAELETQVRALGISDRVMFLGNRTDIAEVYNGLDVVALTSLNEGTPLSLIEAMAAGKTVVSTNVGGVRDLLGEVLEDKDGFVVCSRGIRVESFEADDFARAIEYTLDNYERRSELSTRGSDFIRSSFSKERLIADIKTLYRGLYSE